MKTVRFPDLFNGRLECFGLREHIKPDDTTDRRCCVADGQHYLWANFDEHGQLLFLTRYFPYGPWKILRSISEAFDTLAANSTLWRHFRSKWSKGSTGRANQFLSEPALSTCVQCDDPITEGDKSIPIAGD